MSQGTLSHGGHAPPSRGPAAAQLWLDLGHDFFFFLKLSFCETVSNFWILAQTFCNIF